MNVSETFCGIGSDAISAVPVFENTNATSGTVFTARSTANCISEDCVRPVLGIRMACSAMSSSLSVGTNS